MKTVCKACANFLITLCLLPLIALYQVAVVLIGAERVFPGWSQFFSLVPGLTGVYVRRAFYRWALPHVGRDVWIGFGTVFSHPTATIGESAYIGVGCMIGDVDIANDVLIGSHVSLINGKNQHGIGRLDIPVREQQGEFPRISIGQDTWIGDRAIVMLNLGEHTVVGSGSVVTNEVKDFEIVVGNPARMIATRGSHAANAAAYVPEVDV